jgi:hypothetical protein
MISQSIKILCQGWLRRRANLEFPKTLCLFKVAIFLPGKSS